MASVWLVHAWRETLVHYVPRASRFCANSMCNRYKLPVLVWFPRCGHWNPIVFLLSAFTGECCSPLVLSNVTSVVSLRTVC